MHIALIVMFLALGALLRKTTIVGDRGARRLVAFIINGALPAMAFVGLREVQVNRSMMMPITMPWLLFVFGAGFFVVLGRWLGWPRKTTGAVVLTGALGNTSFLGFPLLEALVGPEALPIAVMADQLGSFLVLATLATAFAAYSAGENVRFSLILRRLALYPPMLAVVVALASRGLVVPAPIMTGLGWLASALSPCSLVAVGLSLRFHGAHWQSVKGPLSLGLAYKLVLAPALFAFGYLWVAGQRGLIPQVTILESAMAPMIMGSVLALETGQDRDVTGAMVMVGIPLSLVTVPIWSFFLKLWG